MRVLTLGMLPIVGLSLGGQAVLSFARGAKNPARLLWGVWNAARAHLCLPSYTVLAAILLRYPVAAIFTNDVEIANIAAQTLVLTHIPFVFFGARQILLVLLQAQGRARLAGFISVAQTAISSCRCSSSSRTGLNLRESWPASFLRQR